MVQVNVELRPPDRVRIWQNLALTMSQASVLTGVSQRQIQHWMDRGYIRPAREGTRKLNGPSLDLILLIDQARSSGVPLRKAVVLAREYLAKESGEDANGPLPPQLFHELRLRLSGVRHGVESVCQLIDRIERE